MVLVLRNLKPAALPLLAFLLSTGCNWWHAPPEPVISFTKTPPFSVGAPNVLSSIEGRVTGARPRQQLVLYAKSGPWWIQPDTAAPFTSVHPDSTWKARTHPGTSYAALLVNEGYRPAFKAETLPEKGGPVLALASVHGSSTIHLSSKKLLFSGYQWQVREIPADPGGTWNSYDPTNAWTDRGRLHLRIAGQPGKWSSAEVNLGRSLGYGSYRFVVSGLSRLEPAAVFSLLTWDEDRPSRQMNIEISRWGEPTAIDGQFVIQPFDIAANSARFKTPPGTVTFMLLWEPGRASFKAFRGVASRWESPPVREHVFTSGVPTPGTEAIHINLYVFDNYGKPLLRGSEVVVEEFEYLP